jgi:hypothetical protein
MKLWHVVQYGNGDEGPDGHDIQCIVSAINMEAALTKASFHFDQYNFAYKDWKKGNADAIYLLGEDNKPDGEAILTVIIWRNPGLNLGRNPAWHRKYKSDEWEEQKFDE